ncbi:uncharacterized protein NPIL_548641 [Nephila pilipes]|uniref:Uncharacterized protein n=1 Tax=Nephila pilipes TaxID=299642 RepID=A0A8X6TH29_NEPPI|nr:uncharacterized protein NPIL_548641 [Nephila pilipes]
MFVLLVPMENKSRSDPTCERKKSVKCYASKVLKESSVSAVSAIVSTGNIPRKVFRVLVFLLFTAGFLYQCIKFLSYILTYPTVVNIEISRPNKYLAPAYTFCNYNMIKRSKFCSKNPDLCEYPDEEFCDMYPRYCGETQTKVPKQNTLRNEENLIESGLEFGHDWKDMLIVSDMVNETVVPNGPLARVNIEELGVTNCYSLNDRVDSPLEATYKTKEMFKFDDDIIEFNPEENEIFYPDAKPGIMFAIHSPFEAINPFEDGIFMEPGNLYRISIQMEEEELLPYPYKTDCLNYTEMWLKANKTGPRSQEMCRHKCLRDITEDCFNCTHIESLYPRRKQFCNDDGIHYGNYLFIVDKLPHCSGSDYEYVVDSFESCLLNCRENCQRTKFSYHVQESYITQKMMINNTRTLSRTIKVKIYFDDSEIIKIRYKPQYQEVEAFSYIGGFIGIWLGVSLVQVVDVFESVFLITRYCFKKGTRKSEEQHTNSYLF